MANMLAAVQASIEKGGRIAHRREFPVRLKQIPVPMLGKEKAMARECRDGVLVNI